VSLLTLLAVAVPVCTRAATGYFVLDEMNYAKGVIIVDGKETSFTMDSSSPLVFNFTSPEYYTGAAPDSDVLTSGNFALSFSTPVSFDYEKVAFDFYGLPSTYTTFTGSGDNAPMILDFPFADPLGTPVTVSTSGGDQTYYPVEQVEATVTSVEVEKAFVQPVINNSTAADGARFYGTISFIDPVNLTDPLIFQAK
jgi:hypothetical protein